MSHNPKLTRLFFKVGVLMFALSLPRLAAAQTWTELTPVGGPSGDELHGVFIANIAHYDQTNNRLIVFLPRSFGFGGEGIPPGTTSDVWILTNANGLGGTPTWIKLITTGTPPAIHNSPSVAYDSGTNKLIVYGGAFFHTSPALDGVFVLTNANGLGGTPVWSQVSVTPPQPRLEHSAVYDPQSNRMIAFGGHFAFFGTDQNDTRILSNADGTTGPSSWATLSIPGPHPGIRGEHAATYDQTNNRMTIFGGQNLVSNSPCCNIPQYNDVWVLLNANGLGGSPTWVQQMPTGSAPSSRSFHSAVYDSANNRMIIFGGGAWNQTEQGFILLGDLWQLSNANGLGGTPVWTELSQSGALPGPNRSHGAAFDVINQRMIVFGGFKQSGNHNQVWVLDLNSSVNHPPTAKCKNVIVSAGPDCTANASVDDGSTDPDGDPIVITQSPSGPYPVGDTVVTLTVSDNRGGTSQCTATVTVVDNAPPMITDASALPSQMWPPDHKMRDVTINYMATDSCGPVSCNLSVSSNELVTGQGDNTSPDWEIIDAHHVRLRAERKGNGDGRIYTITITCTDSAGNSSTRTITVLVPKDQSN